MVMRFSVFSSLFSVALALHLPNAFTGSAMTSASAQRRLPSPEMPLNEADACLLLPNPPYPGEAPEAVGGEMSLQEMEDSVSCSSQLFLNPDGTVTFGATDGPPPANSCGLWQCGEDEFQMTLQRRFPVNTASIDLYGEGRCYTVTRLYRGQVNRQSVAGLKIIEGRIDLYEGDIADDFGWEPSKAVGSNVWSGEVFTGASSSLAMSTPIGYFTLDQAAVEFADLDDAAEDSQSAKH